MLNKRITELPISLQLADSQNQTVRPRTPELSVMPFPGVGRRFKMRYVE
jgi:hypothetical protein